MRSLITFVWVLWVTPFVGHANTYNSTFEGDPVVIRENIHYGKVLSRYYGMKYTDGGFVYINNIYRHICHKFGYTFSIIPDAVNEYEIIIPIEKQEKPKNALQWGDGKTSELAFVMLNGERVHPKMPFFTCELDHNVVEIRYVYGARHKNDSIHEPVIYGDTYPTDMEIEKKGGYYVDLNKYFALFVNGIQITKYTMVNHDMWAQAHIFTYQFDSDRNQYYINVWTAPYALDDRWNYNGEIDTTPYTYNHGNSVIKKSLGVRASIRFPGAIYTFNIKIYSGITQPDGTVSP